MIEEVDFMSKIIGGRVSTPIDLNQIYIENIGNIFVESISSKYILISISDSYMINTRYFEKDYGVKTIGYIQYFDIGI